MIDTDFSRNVFVDCLFDPDNKPIMEVVHFALFCSDSIPRTATDKSDAAESSTLNSTNGSSQMIFGVRFVNHSDSVGYGQLQLL